MFRAFYRNIFHLETVAAAALAVILLCSQAAAAGWVYNAAQKPAAKSTGAAPKRPAAYIPARGLYFDVGGGAQSFYWKPAALNSVSFKTEGLSSYDLYAGLSYDSYPLLSFGYEAPFNPTEKQLYMLAANQKKTEGVERRTYIGTPGTLLYMLDRDLEDNYLVQLLLSLQYDYSKTQFYGSAVATEDFRYAGPGAYVVSVSSRIVGGTTYFPEGQRLTFSTEFKETSSSVVVYNYKKKSHALRVGAFSLNWRRPSANNRLNKINGLPVLYDTYYKVRGAELKWVSTDMTSPGFNADISVRLDNSPEIKQFLPMYLAPDESLQYFAFKLGGCYNWYADPESDGGFFMSLGGSWNSMGFTAEKKKPENYAPAYDNNTYSRTIDAETLYTLYARAGIKFLLADGNGRDGDLTRKVAIGGNYPGVNLKVDVSERFAVEGRAQSAGDIKTGGARLYYYPALNGQRSHLLRPFVAAEGEYIDFAGKWSKGRGSGAGAFAGVEYFVGSNVSVQLDGGPAYIWLKDKDSAIRQGGLEFIMNAGFNMYLF